MAINNPLDLNEVSMAQLPGLLDGLLQVKVPVMIWGPSGVGKSDAVKQAAQRFGGGMVDLRCNLFDPVDLMGVPSVFAGMTVWNPPVMLPDLEVEGTKKVGILFLDELPNAHPSTQSALYQLVLDRRLGAYRMPDEWRIVAAGNRMQDGGGTFAMPTPLKDRFAHFSVRPSMDAWQEWAVKNDQNSKVISFLRYRPTLGHVVDKTKDVFPTFRSWSTLSRVLDAYDQVDIETVASIVGSGAASEYHAFQKVWVELPSLDEMVKAPKKHMPAILAAPDRTYALIGQLVSTLKDNPETVHDIGPIVEALPSEWRQVWLSQVSGVSFPDTLPNWLMRVLGDEDEDDT